MARAATLAAGRGVATFAAIAAGITAALAITGCASDARNAPASRVALVIGNLAYENAPPLINPGHDAVDMCAALRRLGFRTLCHTNLRDRAEFEARVGEYLAALTPNAVGVVYYSGHGVQAANANYLVPTKAQPDEAAADPLRVLYGVDHLFDRLRRHQQRVAQHFQLVVLDACRNDLFEDEPPPPALPGRATERPGASTRLLRALKSHGSAGAGLAPIKDAPPRTIVLYATAAKEAAFDGEGRNGPLTKHVLAHIGTRGLPVEEMIKRVTAGVEAETLRDYRKRQTPFTYGSFTGRFCFAGCPGEADVPPAL